MKTPQGVLSKTLVHASVKSHADPGAVPGGSTMKVKDLLINTVKRHAASAVLAAQEGKCDTAGRYIDGALRAAQMLTRNRKKLKATDRDLLKVNAKIAEVTAYSLDRCYGTGEVNG